MKIAGFTSKRESQILDLAYEKGRITAVDVEEVLPGKPSNSAVRWLLRRLESKGLLTHVADKGSYVYMPTSPREDVAQGELSRLVASFFEGSVVSVMTALLDRNDEFTAEEIADLRKLIDAKEKEVRK